MAESLTALNRSFNRIPKRAESRQADQLKETFVDSGIAVALENIDHQILYGRRGTGKTHALRYLETVVKANGDIPFYIDLRTVGSIESLFGTEFVEPTERAARLLVDLVMQLHDSLLAAALDDDSLIANADFVSHLDTLSQSIASVRISGAVEMSTEAESRTSDKAGGSAGVELSAKPKVTASLSGERQGETRNTSKETRHGEVRRNINFGDVAQALRNLALSTTGTRVWVLMDEWSSIDPDVQPYLGRFLVQCVLPLQMFTVKIAAIEQQSNFRTVLPNGRSLGIEVGADITANLDLDEFMVFEQNEEKARGFFRGLLFKHLNSKVDSSEPSSPIVRESDMIGAAFTDKRAFDELVRAAEGVPRDALNIVAKAAMRAYDRKISVPDIRTAARTWYQTDKEAALRSREEAHRLLNWIIDNVIKKKRARGFMVNQNSVNAPILLALFDARVLHLIRKGYSAQDEPGERYNVYSIDYGAYVEFMTGRYNPLGLLFVGDDGEESYVDVPPQDLRALRRTILDLSEFEAQPAREESPLEE